MFEQQSENLTGHTFIMAPTRLGMSMSVGYIYDELGHGAIPSQAEAERLLADLKAGFAIPHPVSDPGYEQRLEDIIAGRSVDPACFGVRQSGGGEALDVMRADRKWNLGHPARQVKAEPWYRRFDQRIR